jgi:hypothetical protein
MSTKARSAEKKPVSANEGDPEVDVRTATRPDRMFLPDEENVPTQLGQMDRHLRTVGSSELGNVVRALESHVVDAIRAVVRRVRGGGRVSP